MDKETASVIERVTAMVLIALLLIVDALTWKIDHALWSLGIATISGLAGFSVGRWYGGKKPPSTPVDEATETV